MGELSVADLDQARVTSQPVNPIDTGHADGHRSLLYTGVSADTIFNRWTLTALPAITPLGAG